MMRGLSGHTPVAKSMYISKLTSVFTLGVYYMCVCVCPLQSETARAADEIEAGPRPAWSQRLGYGVAVKAEGGQEMHKQYRPCQGRRPRICYQTWVPLDHTTQSLLSLSSHGLAS